MVELRENGFNLSREQTGISDPAYAFTSANGSTPAFFTFLRTIHDKPYALQVTGTTSDDLGKAAYSAYKAIHERSNNTNHAAFINTATVLQENQILTLYGGRYNKVEIRSDGNVLLYPEDAAQGLKYLRASKKKGENTVSWSLIDVKKNTDGSITRKES